MPEMNVILGIDPGSHFTGFGVLATRGPERIEYISCGVIKLPTTLDFNSRIGIVADEIESLIAKFHPKIAVVERVFLGKNADSAFKLGHARGVIIGSAVRAGVEIREYAARAVKKGITGNGASSKEQVQTVLLGALGLRVAGTSFRIDASDALALAYYHARMMTVEDGLARRLHP